jgi:hypothetical protein
LGTLIKQEQTHKVCSLCKKNLPVECFDKHGKHTAGITRYESYCKECKSQKRCNKDAIIVSMLSRARGRAKRKGWKFDLNKEFIYSLDEKQNGLCAVCGVPMEWTTHVKNSRENACFSNCPSNRVSLDRLDASKGYTKDNVQLVCAFINLARSSHSMEDLFKYAKLIVEYNNL